MYIINRFLLNIIGVILLSSLNIKWKRNNKNKTFHKTEIVAQVGKHCLYKSEIEALLSSISDPTVRIDATNQYIRKWKLKYLLALEAAKYSDYDNEDIEKKVESYRNDLIVHNFLEKKIKAQLDTHILDEELHTYYQKHARELLLQYNIIKGKFLSIPIKSTPIINTIKPLFLSQNEEDAKKVVALCLQHGGKCLLDSNKWFDLEEMLKIIGYNPPNKIQFLKKKNSYIRGKNNYFFFKIDDYKLAKSRAPIEFIRDKIKLIILYKRQRDLIKNIEEEVLQKNNDK